MEFNLMINFDFKSYFTNSVSYIYIYKIENLVK